MSSKTLSSGGQPLVVSLRASHRRRTTPGISKFWLCTLWLPCFCQFPNMLKVAFFYRDPLFLNWNQALKKITKWINKDATLDLEMQVFKCAFDTKSCQKPAYYCTTTTPPNPPQSPPHTYTRTLQEQTKESSTWIPQLLECLSCQNDLEGLFWTPDLKNVNLIINTLFT